MVKTCIKPGGRGRQHPGDIFCLLLGPPGFNWCFSFAPELVNYLAPRDLRRRAAYSICESSFFIHHGIYHDLFVYY